MSTSSSPRKTSLPILSEPVPGRSTDTASTQDVKSTVVTGADPEKLPGPNSEHPLTKTIPSPTDEPLFDDAQTEPFPINEIDENDDEIPYEEPSDEATLLPPPPDFRPFFTLIEDSETGEYHHPTVHYIFQDDDPEIVTAAILESIAVSSSQSADEPPSTPNTATIAAAAGGGGGGEVVDGAAEGVEPSNPETSERCILIDFSPDGKTVTGVSSLSAEWQALRTSVGQAPSWGDMGSADAAERGLMLRISGQEIKGMGITDRRGRGRRQQQTPQGLTRGTEELGEVIRGFDERLGFLDEVLGEEGGLDG